MIFASVTDAAKQILSTLFGAGPTGVTAILAMASVFILSYLGLRRGWIDLESQEASFVGLRRWFTEVHRREGVEGSIADDDPDVVLEGSPLGQLPYAQSHGGKVLDLIMKHSRLAVPDANVVAQVARDYSPPGLERQRATQNIILLVGLAGTVFGLAAAIGQVQLNTVDQINSAAANLAIAAFERVLRELPTAFVSTIWGILFALAYGPIAARLESRAQEFTEKVVSTAIRDWIPTTWPESAEAQLDDLRRVMTHTQVTVKRAGEMMGEATANLGSVLQSASGEMGQHVTRLTDVTDESQTVFTRLSQEVTASVGALEAGTQEMQQSLQHLKAFQAEVTNAYTQTQQAFGKKQSETKAQIEDALTVTRDNQAQFSQTIEQVFGRLEGLTASVDQMTNEVLEERRAFDRRFGQIALDMSRAVDRVLETSVDRLGQTATVLSETTGPLRDAVEGLGQLVQSSLAGDEARAPILAVTQALRELNSSTLRLQTALESVNSAIPDQAELSIQNRGVMANLEQISIDLSNLVGYRRQIDSLGRQLEE